MEIKKRKTERRPREVDLREIARKNNYYFYEYYITFIHRCLHSYYFRSHKIYSEYPRNFRRIIYFRIRTCSSSLNVPGPQTRAHLASNLILNRDDRRAAGATVIPDGIANTAASRKYRDKHRARSENGRKGNAETCRRGTFMAAAKSPATRYENDDHPA